MSTKEEKVRTTKVNGTKEDWPSWKQKFLTRSKNKGYRNILNGKMKVPDGIKIINDSTEEGKEEWKPRKTNDDAYEGIIFSIEGNTKKGE